MVVKVKFEIVMRIDKYIWSVRIFKTRSMATKACIEGKVLLNKEIVKGSKLIKTDDEISIKMIPIYRTYRVIESPKTRVGSKLVNNYIIETTSKQELDLLKQYELMKIQNRNLGIKGRPTKKDRRNLNKWSNI